MLLLFPVDHSPGYFQDYEQWFTNIGIPGAGWKRALVRDIYKPEVNPVLRGRKAGDFPVWGPRLLEVQNYPSQERNILLKWWKDDRDETLWITRWSLIAAVFLGILFGLLQSVTGIIQVVYAARSAGTGN